MSNALYEQIKAEYERQKPLTLREDIQARETANNLQNRFNAKHRTTEGLCSDLTHLQNLFDSWCANEYANWLRFETQGIGTPNATFKVFINHLNDVQP